MKCQARMMSQPLQSKNTQKTHRILVTWPRAHSLSAQRDTSRGLRPESLLHNRYAAVSVVGTSLHLWRKQVIICRIVVNDFTCLSFVKKRKEEERSACRIKEGEVGDCCATIVVLLSSYYDGHRPPRKDNVVSNSGTVFIRIERNP